MLKTREQWGGWFHSPTLVALKAILVNNEVDIYILRRN